MSARDVNISPTGAVGTPPPPGAPIETTQPLAPDAGGVVLLDGTVKDPRALAAQNERELRPLVFEKPPLEAPVLTAPTSGVTGKAIKGLDPFYARQAARAAVAEAPAEGPAVVDLAQFPAGSNSDTPRRGLPKPIRDHGKHITGGFGMMPEHYSPLNGDEVKTALEALMDLVHASLQRDLRLTVATTYARAQISVTLAVRGSVMAHPVEIRREQLLDRNPVDVAEQFGDEVLFVVLQQRREENARGESEDPPNKIRQDLGLPIPRRTLRHTAIGTISNDVEF